MNRYQLIFPLIVLGCTSSIEHVSVGQEESKVEPTMENRFSQFLAEIPEYKFPVTMSCDYDQPTKNPELNKYEDFFPEGGNVVSKLNSEVDYALIIFDFACDYSCPTLYSYNQSGVRIDSLNLTPGQCGEDEFMKSKEWFSIDENVRIDLLDSTEHYSFNSSLRILDSTTIETKKYKLDNKGNFEFLSTSTVLIRADN